MGRIFAARRGSPFKSISQVKYAKTRDKTKEIMMQIVVQWYNRFIK